MKWRIFLTNNHPSAIHCLPENKFLSLQGTLSLLDSLAKPAEICDVNARFFSSTIAQRDLELSKGLQGENETSGAIQSEHIYDNRYKPDIS